MSDLVDDGSVDLDDLSWDWEWSIQDISKLTENLDKSYVKKAWFAWFLLIVFILVDIILYFMYNFYTISIKNESEITESEMAIKEWVLGWLSFYNWIIWKSEWWESNELTNNPQLSTMEKQGNVKWYLEDTSIFFYTKKTAIDKWLTEQKSNLLSKTANIEKNDDLKSKYAFFYEELDWLVEENKIVDILSVMESIKMYVISKVTHMTEWKDSDNLAKLKLIVDIWEKWVWAYINNCILNYMTNDECNGKENFHNTIKEISLFDKELNKLLEKNTNFKNDLKSLKNKYKGDEENEEFINKLDLLKEPYRIKLTKMLKRYYADLYAEIMEEWNDYSPVEILFNNYDPETWSLSFTLEIKLMDTHLINGKIQHIDVVNIVIWLLRKSHLILWWNIKVPELKVDVAKVKRWTRNYSVTKTSFNFNIFIQDYVQKEIYDYVEW